MRQQITESRLKNIMKMFGQGVSRKQIAEALNLPSSTVAKVIRRENLARKIANET